MAGGDIIVTGLRESVSKSIDTKRRARQIVEAVTAEDAGKLPDNNVIEAMARLTGVNVTRSQGRADGFTIRGLAGVQTTVNGNDSASAGGRTLSLAAVPAELVKSIEVYKTRTADQVEGGIGGSVNIQLRRPLDLRKGWTLATSLREQYNEQGSTWSPYTSILLANRFDTGIGEMGFLINASANRQNYDEAFNFTESPQSLAFEGLNSTIRRSVPAAQLATTVAPFAATYGVQRGERTQSSISAVFQWKPTNDLSFVLEGFYTGERNRSEYNNFYLNTNLPYYALENIRRAKSGVLLGYDIIADRPNAEGFIESFGIVNGFGGGGQTKDWLNDYRLNFETRYEIPGMWIQAQAIYSKSDFHNHLISSGSRYVGLNRARIDFDSPNNPGGGPFIDFGDVNISNPDVARVNSISDNVSRADNKRFVAQVDLWKQVSERGLLRAVKTGYRYDRFINDFGSSYRFAGFFRDPVDQPRLDSLPGVDTTVITPDIPGGTSFSWLQLNSRQLYRNWAAVRSWIVANEPTFLDGPGRDRGAAEHFATDEPNSDDLVYRGMVKENTFAAYAMAEWGFKALLPIDGNVGLRYVNTWRSTQGVNLLQGPQILDPVTKLPTGEYGPNTSDIVSLRANDIDLLPSVSGVVHFTNKFQLRGSYTYNAQRPDLSSLRNYRNVNFRDPNAFVYAGNPRLGPTTTDDYNVALEYYFAPGGILSLTGFRKEQKGFIYPTRETQAIPELGGQLRTVEMPTNAGPGKTEGLEAQATGFFTFLPGLLRNLGASANATWIPTAEVALPREVDGEPGVREFFVTRAPFVSRWSYNLIGYYETPMFGVRLAYNWRSTFKNGADAFGEQWVQSTRPVTRLDGAITYTPVKFLTFTIEGQNLLRNVDQSYYFRYPELPSGIRAMGRTLIFGVRARF